MTNGPVSSQAAGEMEAHLIDHSHIKCHHRGLLQVSLKLFLKDILVEMLLLLHVLPQENVCVQTMNG